MSNTKKIVTCAMLLSAAVVLSLIPPLRLPLGGKVTIASMVPIIIIPYLFGWRHGLASAFVFALIRMFLGAKNFGYLAPTFTNFALLALLDYIIAFTVLGLGKLFSKNVVIGGSLVIAVRYLCHVLSGVILWSQFAKSADLANGIWAYSFSYNATYMLPEFIISVIVLIILAKVKQIPWAAHT